MKRAIWNDSGSVKIDGKLYSKGKTLPVKSIDPKVYASLVSKGKIKEIDLDEKPGKPVKTAKVEKAEKKEKGEN